MSPRLSGRLPVPFGPIHGMRSCPIVCNNCPSAPSTSRDHRGQIQPCASVLCARADPSNGYAFDVTAALANIPFVRARTKKKTRCEGTSPPCSVRGTSRSISKRQNWHGQVTKVEGGLQKKRPLLLKPCTKQYYAGAATFTNHPRHTRGSGRKVSSIAVMPLIPLLSGPRNPGSLDFQGLRVSDLFVRFPLSLGLDHCPGLLERFLRDGVSCT